jgi:hypothetical protein
MTTTNKRSNVLQKCVFNGVDSGGAMSANIQAGYDNVMFSSPDGMEVPVMDREAQFVRGTITTQDFSEFAGLLSGAVGTYTCYERRSGVAAATGYIRHTITNPVIHNCRFRQTKGKYIEVAFDFECRFSSEAATIGTMWEMTDSQAAPTWTGPARGGFRIVSAVHGSLSIYHLLSFEFGIAMGLARACNDSDLGYTAVDANVEGGMKCDGSLIAEDSEIAANQNKLTQLLLAARASLVLTIKQSAGAANKTITIAGVQFTTGSAGQSSSAADYSTINASFVVSNDPSTPLTLTGTNKIIVIADAA